MGYFVSVFGCVRAGVWVDWRPPTRTDPRTHVLIKLKALGSGAAIVQILETASRCLFRDGCWPGRRCNPDYSEIGYILGEGRAETDRKLGSVGKPDAAAGFRFRRTEPDGALAARPCTHASEQAACLAISTNLQLRALALCQVPLDPGLQRRSLAFQEATSSPIEVQSLRRVRFLVVLFRTSWSRRKDTP